MKKNLLPIFALLTLAWNVITVSSQVVDTTLYRDYNPNGYNMAPPYAVRRAHPAGQRRVPRILPDHVNNGETKYFPPIINQDGGSCGSAQNIGYMLTYELNCYRNTDASLPENQLPTHFTWLLTGHNSDKEVMARTNGVPNVTTYGGRTYSRLFGNQTCDDDDFGWMQGYDKWYSAMWNRSAGSFSMSAPTDTPEGRQELKEWLYDHCGDTSLPAGGVAGIGVAAYGTWAAIPSTPANRLAGVAGMKYVKSWGDTYNHALTICGYDDRVEFDLDGNGVSGEKAKDEIGAWIIANSWGDGWENNGFIYCPYKLCYSVGTDTWAWTPGAHIVRRDYRPLRTIRIKMDYSRRSELLLMGGISENLDATEPDATIPFEHFKNAGNHSNVNPAPEVPMLGRWVDGIHYEPMEFGYDLTDLTATVDRTKPLKYFFVIQTKGTAIGTGNIYECSLINYEIDDNGIEIPFGIEEPVAIRNRGKQTVVSVIVPGEQIYRPQNLSLSDGILSWNKPQPSTLPLAGYYIYEGGELIDSVAADKLSYQLSEVGPVAYTVAAVYRYGKYTHVSDKSNAIAKYVPSEGDNRIVTFSNSGMTVPDAVNQALNKATIEFWMKPTNVRNYNQQIGPGWGTFLFHTDSSGRLVVGWNTGSEERMQLSGAFKASTWAHVAVTINKNVMTAYVNGVRKGSIECPTYSGLAAFGNLEFGHGSDNYWNGAIDEFRIWKTVRTPNEIKNNMRSEIAFPASQEDLLVYLRMDTIHVNGEVKMKELVGGKHASLNNSGSWQFSTNNALFTEQPAFTAAIIAEETTTFTGKPVSFKASTPVNAVKWLWHTEGTNNPDVCSPMATFTFSNPGTYTVSLTATAADGSVAEASVPVTVNEASAPIADFHVAVASLPAGDRFSFINDTQGDGCIFEWFMPGAETEIVHSTNASALYPTIGTFFVTLKATNQKGTSSISKEVTVTEAAPKALFALSATDILLGDSVTLTDKSRYKPTSWEWKLSNNHRGFVFTDSTLTIVPVAPGYYDVTLTTSNSFGSDSFTQGSALVVSNADSHSGLRFSGNGDHFVTSTLVELKGDGLTFDWWMRPSTASPMQILSHISGNLSIATGNDGSVTFTLLGKKVVSESAFVIPGEWHHYAVVYDKGSVSFYRDGILFNTPSQALASSSDLAPGVLYFSSSANGINGLVDEMRVWKSALTKDVLRLYCNAPITDIPTAEMRHALLLYYDFNQSSGDVIDRSSHALHGIRKGFGPDGDAWNSSLGVFTLDLGREPAGDITAQYLTNYQRPYYTASGTVNPTNSSRFRKLEMGTQRSGWKEANAIVNGNIITGAHVDTSHGNDITIETIWSNFADELLDYHLWQTVTLPAGQYTFSCTLSDGTSTQTSRILVNYGSTLLGEEDCESGAIAWNMLNECSVSFTLPQAAEVSLGVIVNMREQSCLSFKEFKLEGIPFESLQPVADEPFEAYYFVINRPADAVTLCEKTLQSHPTVSGTDSLAWHDFDATDPTQLWIREKDDVNQNHCYRNLASGFRVIVNEDFTVAPLGRPDDSYVIPGTDICESGFALLASQYEGTSNSVNIAKTVSLVRANSADLNTARVKQSLAEASDILNRCYVEDKPLAIVANTITSDDADSYVLVDFGSAPSKDFILHTYSQSMQNRPSKVTLYASNDAATWTSLAVYDALPNALPFDLQRAYSEDEAASTSDWSTGIVSIPELYRYLRIEVNNINYDVDGSENLVEGHHRFHLDSIALYGVKSTHIVDAAIVNDFKSLSDDVTARFRTGLAGDYDIQRLTDATHVFASYSSPAYLSLSACVAAFTSDGNNYYSSTFDRTTADAYLAVLLQAQSALANRSLAEDEYAALEEQLRAAYDAILVRRDIEDGLYYIENAFDIPFTKALYAFGDTLVAWNNVDYSNPAFVWEVRYLETVNKACRYLIHNYATGTSLHLADESFAFLTSEGDKVQLIYTLADGEYAIRSEENGLDYYPDFFESGMGTGGRVVGIAPTNEPATPASWRFTPVDDNRLAAVIHSQQLMQQQEELTAQYPFTTQYPLITDAAQISTNLLGGRLSDLAKLIDGKASTKYRSNAVAAEVDEILSGKRPYLQVALNGNTRYVYLVTEAYSPSNPSMRPFKIGISTSPDGETWNEVGVLFNIPNAYPQDGGYIADKASAYRSPVVDLGEHALYVRLTVEDVNYRSHPGNDANLYTDFGLAELMLYDADGATSVLRLSDEKVPDDAVYDLFGHRVSHPLPGTLYIRNGSKFILRP